MTPKIPTTTARYLIILFVFMLSVQSSSAQQSGTWKQVTAQTGIPFKLIDFADSVNGCLFTQDGRYITTTNAGMSWSSLETLKNCTKAVKVSFADKNLGIVVDELTWLDPIAVKLHITTDFGKSWREISLPDSVLSSNGATISIVSKEIIGFIGQRAVLYRTTDLGNSWDTLQLHPKALCNFLHTSDRNNYLRGGGMGLPGSGFVDQSTDAGATWKPIYGGSYAMSEFYTTSLGYILLFSDDGNIVRTATVLYNAKLNSRLMLEDVYAYGALYEDGSYLLLSPFYVLRKSSADSTYYLTAGYPSDLQIRAFTTTSQKHAWILSDSGRVFQRADLLTPVSQNTISNLPATFSLHQNYPNPFNPATTIGYSIPSNSFVTLNVFDLLGKTVATLVNQNQNSGSHYVIFDGLSLPSGMYLYRLQAADLLAVKKFVLLK